MNEVNDKREEELMERARKIVQKKHDLFINIIIYIAANGGFLYEEDIIGFYASKCSTYIKSSRT